MGFFRKIIKRKESDNRQFLIPNSLQIHSVTLGYNLKNKNYENF